MNMINVGHPIPLVPLAYLVTYGEWQASNVYRGPDVSVASISGFLAPANKALEYANFSAQLLHLHCQLQQLRRFNRTLRVSQGWVEYRP